MSFEQPNNIDENKINEIVRVMTKIPLNKDEGYEDNELLKHFDVDLSGNARIMLKDIFTSIAIDTPLTDEQKNFLLKIFKE
jgi:hypothetical protein